MAMLASAGRAAARTHVLPHPALCLSARLLSTAAASAAPAAAVAPAAAASSASSGGAAAYVGRNRVDRYAHNPKPRLEDTATFQGRVRVLQQDGAELLQAEAHARAAEAQAYAAANHVVLAADAGDVSPLSAELSADAAAAAEAARTNTETGLATVPGQSAYSGRSALPVSPLSAELFRSQSLASVARGRKLNIKCSPQKLNDLCRPIRGVSVTEAIIQLDLSQKQKTYHLSKLITNTANNAVANFNMDKNRLYVAELRVGHGTHLKRLDIKGRGRCAVKLSYRSHLYVELREQGSDGERYRGIWKHGGQSHNPRTGEEWRVGRVGRRISTVQRTLEQMAAWRTARGMDATPARKDEPTVLAADVKRAYRATGIATDFDLVYGTQIPQPGMKRMHKLPEKFVAASWIHAQKVANAKPKEQPSKAKRDEDDM